jgi:hypothetical protein
MTSTNHPQVRGMRGMQAMFQPFAREIAGSLYQGPRTGRAISGASGGKVARIPRIPRSGVEGRCVASFGEPRLEEVEKGSFVPVPRFALRERYGEAS